MVNNVIPKCRLIKASTRAYPQFIAMNDVPGLNG